MWLDFREPESMPMRLDRRIIYDAKLWLDSGKIFGKTGTGFQRINVAAPRTTIEECMERIKKCCDLEIYVHLQVIKRIHLRFGKVLSSSLAV